MGFQDISILVLKIELLGKSNFWAPWDFFLDSLDPIALRILIPSKIPRCHRASHKSPIRLPNRGHYWRCHAVTSYCARGLNFGQISRLKIPTGAPSDFHAGEKEKRDEWTAEIIYALHKYAEITCSGQICNIICRGPWSRLRTWAGRRGIILQLCNLTRQGACEQ